MLQTREAAELVLFSALVCKSEMENSRLPQPPPSSPAPQPGLGVGGVVLKLRGSKEVQVWKQEVGVGQSVTIKGAYKWSN